MKGPTLWQRLKRKISFIFIFAFFFIYHPHFSFYPSYLLLFAMRIFLSEFFYPHFFIRRYPVRVLQTPPDWLELLWLVIENNDNNNKHKAEQEQDGMEPLKLISLLALYSQVKLLRDVYTSCCYIVKLITSSVISRRGKIYLPLKNRWYAFKFLKDACNTTYLQSKIVQYQRSQISP